MAEELVMTKETTPKKVAFASKPYSKEDKRKKEEDELKELLEEQKKDVEEVTKPETSTDGEPEPDNAEERSFKKRYGDLRRHSQKQTEDFKKEIDSLKNQLDSATRKEITLPKSDEDIEAWTKQYPDVAAIVETIATKKAMEQSKNLEERMKTIDEMQFNVTKEKAENELLRIHPDFGEIRDSDEFHEWAEEQPKWVQDSLYENDNDAKSAARAIDLYKSDKSITPKKVSNNKDAAKLVDTKGTRSKPVENESKSYLKESTVEKMSAQEYEKKSDDIMEAIRSGKFIYDISGSAR
tara:strand:- start:562 stop:1446 length:885 start_codon:yes stop_codon:yes gene_type:complete